MAQMYDDDDMINEVLPEDDYDETNIEERVAARYAMKLDAVLTETNIKVLLELTGSSHYATNRPGLDLVMVLDVSGNMSKHGRMEQMKIGSKSVVKKLAPIDRLSIIKFSNHAQRLCPLRQMTLDAQSETEMLIGNLQCESTTTNMTDNEALEEAVRVLKHRRFTNKRQVAIMFVSGAEPLPKVVDATQVCFQDVPVHTFGLGHDTEHKVLYNIASRSELGTFSTIEDAESTDSSNLSIALTKCLTGLQYVAVKDLTLTITPVKASSRIVNVCAGRFQPDDAIIKPEEPVTTTTISFGNLNTGEIRSILVDLFLEGVAKPQHTDVLEFTVSYTDLITEEPYEAPRVIIRVHRTQSGSITENVEVLMEEARQNYYEKIKQAIVHGDANNLEGVQVIINEALKDLHQTTVDVDKSNPKFKAIEAELAQFLKYSESDDRNNNQCQAFALSTQLSHATQRFATRGDPINGLHYLFSTYPMTTDMSLPSPGLLGSAPPIYHADVTISSKVPSSLLYQITDKDEVIIFK